MPELISAKVGRAGINELLMAFAASGSECVVRVMYATLVEAPHIKRAFVTIDDATAALSLRELRWLANALARDQPDIADRDFKRLGALLSDAADQVEAVEAKQNQRLH